MRCRLSSAFGVAIISQEKVVSRCVVQAIAVLPAGRGANRLPHGFLRQAARQLHQHALRRLAGRWVGRGVNAVALAIGEKPPISIEGNFAPYRRILRGAGRAYFPRMA